MTRILVVEDEQHLAEGLRFNLEADGYEVSVLDTGEAALEVLVNESDPFDVVVLDIMLPGKDGFSVMSEMRQAGVFVPTLMLTSRDDPFIAVESFEQLQAPDCINVCILPRGGHIGFLGWDGSGGIRWAERRIAEWVTKPLGAVRK